MRKKVIVKVVLLVVVWLVRILKFHQVVAKIAE